MTEENVNNDNMLVEETDKNEAVSKKRGAKRRQNIALPFVLCLVMCLCIAVAWNIGKRRLKDAYGMAEKEAYNDIYQTAFEKAEAANHVSNHVFISIGDVQEIARLEVLEVQGSEFVVKNAEGKDKITSWLEVYGTGVFTVDLSMGEFIADSERAYVLVRVPKPALTEVKLTGTGKQFWKDDRILRNGSVQEGVKLSQEQRNEGKMKLEDSIRKNGRFHEESKKAAIRIITSLVQEWNPNIPELQVEVEFMEDSM